MVSYTVHNYCLSLCRALSLLLSQFVFRWCALRADGAGSGFTVLAFGDLCSFSLAVASHVRVNNSSLAATGLFGMKVS